MKMRKFSQIFDKDHEKISFISGKKALFECEDNVGNFC